MSPLMAKHPLKRRVVVAAAVCLHPALSPFLINHLQTQFSLLIMNLKYFTVMSDYLFARIILAGPYHTRWNILQIHEILFYIS